MEPTFLVPEPARQQEDTGRSAYFQSLNNGRLTHAPPPSPVSQPTKKTAAVEAPKPLKLDHKLVYKAIKKVKRQEMWKKNCQKKVKANLKKTLKKFEQLGLARK